MKKIFNIFASLILLISICNKSHAYGYNGPDVDPYLMLSPNDLCDSINSIISDFDRITSSDEIPANTSKYGFYDRDIPKEIEYILPDTISILPKDIIHVKDPVTASILEFLYHIADVPLSTNLKELLIPVNYLLRSDARRLSNFFRGIKYDCKDIFTFWLDFKLIEQYPDIEYKDKTNFYSKKATDVYLAKDELKALKELPDSYYARTSILEYYAYKKYMEMRGILRLLPQNNTEW